VVTIADLSSLEVEADVSESNLGMVSVGAPCDITLDALPAERFRGIVDTIVPTVDRSKATVLVKVRFMDMNPRILPEMSAKVSFLTRSLKPDEQKARIMVSKSAIVRSEGEGFVFLVLDEKAVKAPVKTGEEFGGMVTVLHGLKPGDTVVTNPPKGLKNGAKVTILEK
jgi:RND family efflux transporter MFP subunit